MNRYLVCLIWGFIGAINGFLIGFVLSFFLYELLLAYFKSANSSEAALPREMLVITLFMMICTGCGMTAGLLYGIKTAEDKPPE